MTELNAYWMSVVNALRDHKFQFRIKWSGDAVMTAWQPWVICPTDGYLETGSLGPVRICEVEWLDVSLNDRDGHERSEQMSEILNEINASFTMTTDSIQITSNAPTRE